MKYIFFIVFALFSLSATAKVVQSPDYLENICQALSKKWPENKTVNLVFHGHSVPSAYFNTPNVRTMQAYPNLVLQAVKEAYPYAVVNSITTAIGGENAVQGAKRFKRDVLSHRPDVLFIDYALNDRTNGTDKSRRAWEEMIKEAQKLGIKIFLLTPTPDLTEDILDDNAPLEKHSRQIRELASQYKTGLIDSYAAFKEKKKNGEDLKIYMSQSNHPNKRGHEEVKELIMDYFLLGERKKKYQSTQILKIMEKVADWQLMHFETQAHKGSRWPNSHAYWAWTNATMYIGMAEWAKLSENKKYWDFLVTIGEKNQWETGPSTYFADDLCIAQAYQQLYERYKDTKMIQPSLNVLDEIMTHPKTGSLSYSAKDSHSRWCWCDALFMAPTAFARFGKTTGNKQYFDFMNQEFWVAYDSLYCPQEKLFFRDTRYKTMKEENGEKVFWGRGNGWVIGGLTIIIDHLPDNHSYRSRFVALYKEMMGRIASLQDSRGFWHPSMLDTKAYPMPETSASGFFTYGLLWGINRGYLDEALYLPHAQKAWNALCSAVHDDGKLGYVQAIGADPRNVSADDTEVYGVGAFLLAGTEMYHYLNR